MTTPTPTPRIAIIGGSGLGQALLAQTSGQALPLPVSTPFGPPSADPLLLNFSGVPVVFLARHGLGHRLPPSAVPYRANIYALKSLGCNWILASGAVGSLREHIAPRHLAIPHQLIDKTTRRAATFFDDPGLAVHVEFADPFCPLLRSLLLDSAATLPTKTHPLATYVAMEGPAFSTRAESEMHRLWGGDLIGMTAMPEAKLAREAELSYALIALATDYDCWKPHSVGAPDDPHARQALLAEILSHLHAATDNALALIRAALPRIWESRHQHFPAHHALELALWTDKSAIPPQTKQKLLLLLSRYL